MTSDRRFREAMRRSAHLHARSYGGGGYPRGLCAIMFGLFGRATMSRSFGSLITLRPSTTTASAIAVPLLRLAEKSVGDHLRLYRRRKGLSQAEVAKATGMSQASVSRMERAPESATVGQLQSFCRCLDITVFDLLEDVPVEFTVNQAKSLRPKNLR